MPSDSLLSSSREVLLNIAQTECEFLEQLFAVYLIFRGGGTIDETVWKPWLDRVGELGKLEILILSGILRFNHLKELSDQIWIKQFDKKFSASKSSIFCGHSQELWFEILSLEQRRYPEATVRSHFFSHFENTGLMNTIQKALFLYGLSLSYSGYRPSESEAKFKLIDGQELGLNRGRRPVFF